jgi:hypothetical protein
MPKHLTVLIANEPGRFQEIAELLASCVPPVNIWAHHMATTGRTGVVQMVCVPHQVAIRALSAKYGHYVAESEILAIKVPNEPGRLLQILLLLLAHNLVSSYQTLDVDGQTVLLLEFDSEEDLKAARVTVSEGGYTLIESIAEQDGTGE